MKFPSVIIDVGRHLFHYLHNLGLNKTDCLHASVSMCMLYFIRNFRIAPVLIRSKKSKDFKTENCLISVVGTGRWLRRTCPHFFDVPPTFQNVPTSL